MSEWRVLINLSRRHAKFWSAEVEASEYTGKVKYGRILQYTREYNYQRGGRYIERKVVEKIEEGYDDAGIQDSGNINSIRRLIILMFHYRETFVQGHYANDVRHIASKIGYLISNSPLADIVNNPAEYSFERIRDLLIGRFADELIGPIRVPQEEESEEPAQSHQEEPQIQQSPPKPRRGRNQNDEINRSKLKTTRQGNIRGYNPYTRPSLGGLNVEIRRLSTLAESSNNMRNKIKRFFSIIPTQFRIAGQNDDPISLMLQPSYPTFLMVLSGTTIYGFLGINRARAVVSSFYLKSNTPNMKTVFELCVYKLAVATQQNDISFYVNKFPGYIKQMFNEKFDYGDILFHREDRLEVYVIKRSVIFSKFSGVSSYDERFIRRW